MRRILATIVFAVCAVGAQPSLEQRIDAAIASIKAEVPGISVAIAIDGKTVYAKGVGTISLTSTVPPTAETQYRTASVSKPITATAVFKLVARGAIDLDTPAAEYCPVLLSLNGAPTVRHFLLHQSGMRHTNDDEDEGITGEFPRLSAALTRIVKEPLQFPPGSRTLYTSWGYTALGCVIESVTNRSFADFVQAEVFAPAGMRNSAFDAPAFTSPTFTPGYRRQGNRFQPSVVVDTRFKSPASGVISTVTDLNRFATALMDGTLLPPALFRDMTTTRPTPADTPPALAAGWMSGPANLGTPAFNHNGSMEGTTAWLIVLPERRISIAVLTNRERFVTGVLPVVREAIRASIGLPPAP
jgi:CubicO group peptidase (beta-lactamase class C family)